MTRSSVGETADVSDPQPQILVDEVAAGSENIAGVNGNRLMDVNDGEPPQDQWTKVKEGQQPSPTPEHQLGANGKPQRKKRAAAKTVSLRKSNPSSTVDGNENLNSESEGRHIIGSEHEDEGFNEAVNDFVQNEFLSPDDRKNEFVVSDDSNNIAFEAELARPEVASNENGDLPMTPSGSQSVNSFLNTPLASPSKSKVPPPSRRYNANGEETTVWKDHYFSPGLLVYCPWPGKNPNHERKHEVLIVGLS